MKINQLSALFLVVGALVLSGCWNQNKSGASTNAPTLYVVNVLSKELYDDAHIKGSMWVDLDDLELKAQQWDKNTPVVFYCSNYYCTASSHAARELKKAGFAHVYAYEGGMAEWHQLGKNDPSYVTEGPAQQSYLSQVIEAPAEAHNDIEIITAASLKDKMVSAGLL